MVIALITDFGTRDHFVASVKGTILCVNPDAVIVDITHEIEPQNILEAAFTLNACFRDFPPGTIFVCVVDPGVGSDRKAVVVRTKEYLFVAPDNGSLGNVLDEGGDIEAFEITDPLFLRGTVSSTFHGRDIFAPAAAHLSKGALPGDLGPPVSELYRTEMPRPADVSPGVVRGVIMHIDRFGNLITNFRSGNLPARFTLEAGRTTVAKHLRYYDQAVPGQLFTLFGSSGLLEISLRQASAAAFLGVKQGDVVLVRS
jgi:S-adenosylmethionine hydrolase